MNSKRKRSNLIGRDRYAVEFAGVLLIAILLLVHTSASANTRRSERSIIRGGLVVSAQSEVESKRDSMQMGNDAIERDSLTTALMTADSIYADSIYADSVNANSIVPDSTAVTSTTSSSLLDQNLVYQDNKTREIKERTPFITDSMSLSRVCWTSAALPGFGQIYNKQYWKLPILYGTLATGIALYAHENKTYKPLKKEYDEISLGVYSRNEYLDEVQAKMIQSNTRRQLYLGATVASYIYFLGDAAINYSTNDVSNIKKATTLATICPGAGQIYNKSYWKVPFVIGGFASMIYVVDWNNRGYQRFKTAYNLTADYEANPDDYPDGATDEFGGRYSASYLQSIRDSYRRNRDLSIIMLAGLYLLQIVDAHVDAHFKDFDISDDLTVNIEPNVGYTYSPTTNSNCTTFGFNLGLKF